MGDLQIKVRCWICQGDGIYQGEQCPSCNGEGKLNSPEGITTIDVTEVTDKIQEVKTKVNQIQADVNYIRATVANIWDKVK